MHQLGRSGVMSISVVSVLVLAGAAMGSGSPIRDRQRFTPPGDILAAVDEVAARSDDPDARRGTLLWRLRTSPMCYASDLSQADLERLIAETDLLPPTLDAGGISTRFYTDSFIWVGDLSIGPSNRAQPASLTYSFPDDGVNWGLSSTSRVAPNNINARLTTTFTDVDRGREYMRAGLASWKRACGISYTEVSDDNTPMTGESARVATRGDIRIGGFPFLSSDVPNGTLAYNGFPTAMGASSVAGGDMAINTSYFIPSTFQSNVADYRYFRNTVAHEHGHGLACIHSIPCDRTKLMEPTITTDFNMLQRDEIRAAQRNYGDRFAGNQSAANAKDFGNLTSPIVRSVLVRDLSTNGSTGFGFTSEDFYRFTIDTPQSVNITVTPVGESSLQGQQIGSCSGTEVTVDSLTAGNLRFELRDASNVLIFSANTQPAGSPETLNVPALGAGTYILYVRDGGPNPVANQVLQNYDLLIRIGTAKAPPDAIAGLNKRVRAGTNAWFNGSVNSRATETGATLPVSGYDWDLDGDGAIDVDDTAAPSTIYPSNGVYPVTLRLTDSNGTTATDTINVTVFGATTAVTSISPPSGTPGTSVPVTIIGTNFRGVVAASQVTVTTAGGGVSVIGTPVVNTLGTQISGLSFVVAAGALPGTRTVNITNADGQGASGSGAAVFTVGAPPGPPINDECAGAMSWGNLTGLRPFSNISATRSSSQSFAGTGCPAPGFIENDVWFTWTAPASGNLVVSTDSAAVGFSTRVAVYRASAGCPPTGNAFRCDDFNASFNLAVTANANYTFQVGSTTANITGTANVILNLSPTQGSCCLPSGVCSITADTGCPGGQWFFSGVCTPNTCEQPTGACCTATGCTVVEQAVCSNLPGDWRGASTLCGEAGNPIACCPANFNQFGGVTLQDIFDYLTAWFSNTPDADFNGVGGVTLQDLFDFLGAWFAGCP